MHIYDTNSDDGNNKICKCGHLLEDHEEFIGNACTHEKCTCLKYMEV